MIFYCVKVILFAFLVALTLTTAQDDSFDEGESSEIDDSTEQTLTSTNSATTSLADESQNPISEAVIGIVVGAVGIAISAALFYYLWTRRKKDKASTDDGGGETDRGYPPIASLTNPLIDLIPKDNIIKGGIAEVSAEDPGIGPGSTIIELPAGTETSRKGEHEQIIVTHHGAAKDVDPSKLDIPPQEIHGAYNISSSSVDLSQGQGPSGNDFE